MEVELPHPSFGRAAGIRIETLFAAAGLSPVFLSNRSLFFWKSREGKSREGKGREGKGREEAEANGEKKIELCRIKGGKEEGRKKGRELRS